jgi:hypothetical protein
MTTAKECCTQAKKCFVRAQETDSEESRQASLEMASYWMDARHADGVFRRQPRLVRTVGCPTRLPVGT